MRSCLPPAVMALLFGICLQANAALQEGINELGRGNYDSAIEIFMPSAMQGDVVSQNFLAHTYKLMQKYSESYAWYELSATCNDSIDAGLELAILKQKMSPQAVELGEVLAADLFDSHCGK